MAEGAPSAAAADVTDVRQPLMTTILEHVERGEAQQVGVIMESRSIAEQLKSIAWDLVPQVCDFLTQDVLTDRPQVIITAETVLSQLALKAKPKEVLLVLLEQADTFKDDVKFKTILPAIQTCLLQLPAKRGHSIAIVVETLYAHLATLTLPEYQTLEGEERKLLENDDEVRRMNDVSRAMIDFLKPLGENITYREMTRCVGKVKDASEQKELVRCVLKLLNHPMSNMDTSYHGGQEGKTDSRLNAERQEVKTDSRLNAERQEVKTDSRLNAERLMSVLSLIQPDYIKLLQHLQEENFHMERHKEEATRRRNEAIEQGDIPDLDDEYDVQEKHLELSLSMLAYLAFGEDLGLERFPQVYTAQFVFESVLPYVSHLLSHVHPVVVEKGVRLLHGALTRVPPDSMPAELLEWEEIGHVVGRLVQVMTQSQSKASCQAAVSILPLWLSRFTSAGRHKSLYFIFVKERHPGLVGYAIQLLKNEIDRALRLPPPGDEYFLGSHLDKLLVLVLRLQHGVQTDLLDQSDRVMAALNLLRYLTIRDKPTQNMTGVWSHLPRIHKDLCEPLHSGIDMSRAHYQLELSKVKDGTSDILNRKKKGAGGAATPEVDFSVGGRSLPNLTPQQEVEVMQTALHTFDMMQSVLVRVEELIQQQRKDADTTP